MISGNVGDRFSQGITLSCVTSQRVSLESHAEIFFEHLWLTSHGVRVERRTLESEYLIPASNSYSWRDTLPDHSHKINAFRKPRPAKLIAAFAFTGTEKVTRLLYCNYDVGGLMK